MSSCCSAAPSARNVIPEDGKRKNAANATAKGAQHGGTGVGLRRVSKGCTADPPPAARVGEAGSRTDPIRGGRCGARARTRKESRQGWCRKHSAGMLTTPSFFVTPCTRTSVAPRTPTRRGARSRRHTPCAGGIVCCPGCRLDRGPSSARGGPSTVASACDRQSVEPRAHPHDAAGAGAPAPAGRCRSGKGPGRKRLPLGVFDR